MSTNIITTSSTPSTSSINPLHNLFHNNQLRFEVELEFVSLLANPHYLQYLAQNRYLDDNNPDNILKYIDYLQYMNGFIKLYICC